MSYVKLLNDMTWSFSRLHAYEHCPYSFYLRYIEERSGESNYYAENGKCMHETFEALFNRKIEIESCPQFYSDRYDMICEMTKKSTMDSTFEKCIDYLCEVEDLDETKYEILGVEIKLDFKVGKYKFVGYADLVVRNRDSGEVILVDHKQAGHFFKKDGTPLKNQEDNFFAYKHQAYLYCKGLKDCFGINVDKIVWHHFKDSGQITKIPFNVEEFDETMQWAVNTIEKIKQDKSFESNKTYIMCNCLCDFRNDCEYKNDEE